ncbi:MAG: AI-2E family transporter, partial [Candidatus Limnocylindria bacterium]
MTGPALETPGGIGPRERRWLIGFLVLGSAYFAVLLLERLLNVVGGFGSIVLILFLAWLLSFVMSPLVAWLEERLDAPRPPIVVGTYLLALIVLGFVLFYTGAALTQQVAEMADRYPETERDILAVLTDWQRSLQLGRLQVDLTDLYAGAVTQAERLGRDIVGQAQGIAGGTIAAL